MAAAFRRKVTGHPRSDDPRMSLRSLHDFTRKVPGAPERKNQKYGSSPVSEAT